MGRTNAIAEVYKKGFKDGVLKGSREVATEYIEKDLQYIYGSMALLMHERHYTKETIEKWIYDIQEFWNEDCKHQCDDDYVSILERVREKTGLDLQQVFNVDETV